jgi:ligand-binding SRPBCC domain-containing protein
MTTLHNRIEIRAPRNEVWRLLTTLDALASYDPGVNASQLLGTQKEGLGAARRCEVPGGFFEERVDLYEPAERLAFELTRCSFPITGLRHEYRILEDGDTTVVEQTMRYSLKYGVLGRMADALFLRRTWDKGIKGFMAGLKAEVEKGA